MVTIDLRERVRQLREAAAGQPDPLQTQNSPSSARSSAGQGLAMLPFLTINDIIVLREHGFMELEDIQDGILEVPDAAWDHVLFLVRTGVLELKEADLEAQRVAAEANEAEKGNAQCLALTKSGTRCRNRSRDGSKYCASHKGYQPSQEELEARKMGIFPNA